MKQLLRSLAATFVIAVAFLHNPPEAHAVPCGVICGYSCQTFQYKSSYCLQLYGGRCFYVSCNPNYPDCWLCSDDSVMT